MNLLARGLFRESDTLGAIMDQLAFTVDQAPLPAPPPLPALSDFNRRRNLSIELTVMLVVCVLPYLSSSAMYASGAAHFVTRRFSILDSISGIVSNLRTIAVAFFVIWRSGDSFAKFGIRRFRFAPDVIGGVVICVALRFGIRWFWVALHALMSGHDYHFIVAGSTATQLGPSSAIQYAILGIGCLSTGISEELTMRCYFITRLEEMLGSRYYAIILSTCLFACAHVYQGATGVIDAAISGLILAVAFCALRRLLPVAFAHALNNFLVISHYPTR
jgi:membrane protease YdiL (CAAX protease family)